MRSAVFVTAAVLGAVAAGAQVHGRDGITLPDPPVVKTGPVVDEYKSAAQGVPTTVELLITDVSKSGAPFAGAAVYVWHCDRDGLYSLYSQGATNQNYLRGVQEADANGKVTFTTIFPGAYSGRCSFAR